MEKGSLKVTALVCSARQIGNCFDLAEYTLKYMKSQKDVETELVNFYDYDIQPCHHCNYECFYRYGESVCPVKDDVPSIWEKAWSSDALLYFIPCYGGVLPALWFAFYQRLQDLWVKQPTEKEKKKVLSVFTFSSVKGSRGGLSDLIMRKYAFASPRRLACFESLSTESLGLNPLKNRLIKDARVKQRLRWLADQTLKLI